MMGGTSRYYGWIYPGNVRRTAYYEDLSYECWVSICFIQLERDAKLSVRHRTGKAVLLQAVWQMILESKLLTFL